MSIYIFSRPIHSGKTTKLQHWCNQQKNIAGILMPDINGCRKILDLSTYTVFDIECTDAAVTKESLTTIGRFQFYTKAFEKANSIILNALKQSPNWLIIDEAGKLELDEKGFYSAVVKAIEFYNKPHSTGHLLLTVRDSLVEEFISFFGLEGCRIISRLEDTE